MIRRSLAVCAMLVLTSSLSLAQTGGSSGGSSSGGSTSGGGGSTSSGRGTTGGGSSGGGSGNSATSGGLGGQTLNITGASSATPGIATSSSLNASNPFSKTVGNPLYAGRIGSTVTAGPGGFGQSTYTAANSTAARGTAGGTGAVNVGGSSGTSFTPTSSTSTIRVRYAANLRFPTRPVSGSELQGQLREILDTSTSLSAPGRVSVVVEDRIVTLRGNASDDDERRLIEGMLRMTPGVREIRNELQIP